MKKGEKFINLFTEMARAGIEWQDLEDVIGKSRTSIYMKRTGKVSWTLGEMLAIQKFLNDEYAHVHPEKKFSLDYLFKS